MSEKVMLAKAWEGQNPIGWYMSEKLDGVRAIWYPEIRGFISRNGKPIVSPDWFIKNMPNVTLDGELFMGRGLFKECSGMVRRKTNQDWSNIEYRVFATPGHGSSFTIVLPYLEALKLPTHVKIQEQIMCRSHSHLIDFEQSILSQGGEGVMLRNPLTPYEYRRSPNLLKVKRFKDAEAVVTGYKSGVGKYENMMGALVCNYNGISIDIGTGFTDEERRNPPTIGNIITFKYFEIDNVSGIPRFPVYLGIRGHICQNEQ